MICSNCGFHNEPGDEFCGNCGSYLEFSGSPSDEASGGAGQPSTDRGAGYAGAGVAGAGAAAGGVDAAGMGASGRDTVGGDAGSTSGAGRGTADSGRVGPDDQTAVHTTPPHGAGVTSGGGPSTGTGRSTEIICWNCGRRNPAGRSFCMQCGTRLTTAGAAAGGAGGGAGYQATRGATDDGGGGGGRRTIALIAGLIALLLLAGIGGAAFLGLFGGRPGPTLVAVVSPSASPIATQSATSSAGVTPFTPGPTGSFAFPSIVVTAPVFTLAPTEPPRPTRRPRCDEHGQPPGCRPTPEPATPTPEPTPVNCLGSVADRSLTLTPESPTRTIMAGGAWCVHRVTFTNASLSGATGTLKVFLENPEFIGPPGNYGMAKIGWPPGSTGKCEASIESDFTSSSEFVADCAYPFGYEVIPPETIVSFEIVGCGTNGTCSGSVTIEFDRRRVP